ncbi:MAG: LysR substrate-binding domain-containing protein [Bosea sp. (in: a-proteobacteria)]
MSLSIIGSNGEGAMQLGNLDLDLLHSFVTIAEAGGFTRAGERLLRTQSTLSLQLKRLETRLGGRLFDRTPRSLALTPLGETLLPEARGLLAAHDALLARLSEPEIEGIVRLGTPEDFATAHLPDVLARFAKAHPRVALDVTCDLTLNLLAGYRSGGFDMVLIKREPTTDAGGVRVWREPLVWVGAPSARTTSMAELPLVVSPTPCVYRKRATEALDKARLRWRIAYTCGSLAGALAAVKAGLGLTVLPKEMVPPGFAILDGEHATGLALPNMADTEIALLCAPSSRGPVMRLQEHIIRSLERAGA